MPRPVPLADVKREPMEPRRPWPEEVDLRTKVKALVVCTCREGNAENMCSRGPIGNQVSRHAQAVLMGNSATYVHALIVRVC